MTDKPVLITIEHPSCDGCADETTPDYSNCIRCFYHKAPMEHQNYRPKRGKKK